VKFTAESEIRDILITLGASTTPPSDSMHGVHYLRHESDEAIPDPTSKSEWGEGEVLYLQFQVTDTGRGMTEEELKPVFQRFSQASPKTHARKLNTFAGSDSVLINSEYGGSGLGLYIARLLTRLQGGQIGVISVPGRGSTFAFYITVRRSHVLPPEFDVRDKSTPVAVLETSGRPRHCSNFTILIVEDNLGL
jgi:signal transduction histidine kinase